MKRQLLIHAGYGKTATTWLQRRIFPNIPGSIYLGKDPFIDPALEDIHNRLFQPLYAVDRYRARNSAMLVNEYAACIRSLAGAKAGSAGKVVISDECMMDYSNYNAELNMYLLGQLKRKLAADFDEIKVLMTIRNQETFLVSYFAYDYFVLKQKFKTFREFLDYGSAHPSEAVFGGIRYNMVFSEMSDIFGKDNCKFVPYELLVADPVTFLNQIATFWDIDAVALEDHAHAPAENVNKTADGAHVVRDLNLAGSYLFKLASTYRRMALSQKLSPAWHSFAKQNFRKISGKLSRTKPVGHAVLDQEARKKIHSMYRDDNRQLMALAGIDLESFGWPV